MCCVHVAGYGIFPEVLKTTSTELTFDQTQATQSYAYQHEASDERNALNQLTSCEVNHLFLEPRQTEP
eukprot:2243294-Prymnesium_polylepis.1